MRCKACNNILQDYELVTRMIKYEGVEHSVDEDLCKSCRTDLYVDADALQIDPMSLGIDIVMEDDGL